MEVNYPEVIVRGAIIPALIVRGQFFWGSLFGRGGNYPGAIIMGAIVRGGIVLGDNCPGGQLSRGQLS